MNSRSLSALALAFSLAGAASPARADSPPEKRPKATGDVKSVGLHNVKVDGKVESTGDAHERVNVNAAAPATPAPAIVPAVDDGITRERVEKAMRRYQKPIQGCVDAAHRRWAKVGGQIDLMIQVAERKVTLQVQKDTTGDPKVAQCLTDSAKTWELPAASFAMPWTVTVGPAAAPATAPAPATTPAK